MYRYTKLTRLTALVLAALLLTGCTSPSQVIQSTTAAKAPLVTTTAPAATTKAPASTTSATQAAKPDIVPDFGDYTTASGTVYPYASGKAVTQANFPGCYASIDLGYNIWSYQISNGSGYGIDITLPFEEAVAKGENTEPYLAADAEVSKTIVTRIIEQAEHLASAGLPKMRGQQKYAAMQTLGVYVSVHMQTVINNIASFVILRNIELQDADGANHWVNDTVTLNFDLNTGDFVPLAALFTDGYDYKARLNAEIQAYLTENAPIDDSRYGRDYMLRLLAPFAGIRDDQPWYLAGERLYIILDFENPELHMDNADYSIDIPLLRLCDCLALYDRYASDEVRTADAPVYVLTATVDESRGVGANFDFGDPEKYLYRSVTYMTDSLPIAAQTAFLNWVTMEQPTPETFKNMADADIAYGEGYTRAYEQTAYTSVSGDFAVLSINAYQWGFAQKQLNTDYGADYCWNLEADRPAIITDFFKDGFDYVTALEDCLGARAYYAAIVKHADGLDTLVDTTVPPTNEPMQKDTLMLFPTARGFNLRINLSEDRWGDLYEEYGGSLGCYIPYEEIGYENLTLFE